MKYTRSSTGIILSVIAIIYVVYAMRVFPIPGTDSSAFLPPALTFGQGKVFSNPIYYLSDITDFTGNHLFNYYVPFYSFFFSFWVAAIPGIKTIFVVGALLTIMALFLYRRIIIKSSPVSTGKLFAVTVLLSFPYLATYSLPTIGRPEQLTAPLLLLLWLLYRNRVRIAYHIYNILLMVIFAVLLSTQVTGFYFAFLVFLIVEFLEQGDARRLVIVNVVRIIGVLLLFYFILEASPNGFMTTVRGIFSHSSILFRKIGWNIRLFAFYWLFSPFNIGFVVVFVAGFRYWCLYLRHALPAVATVNKWIIASLHVPLVVGFFALIIHRLPAVYNATQYIYVLLLFLLLNYDKYRSSKYNFLILPSLMLTFLVGSLLFLRTLVLFADNEADGRDYDTAKNKLAEVEAKYGKCFVHVNLWSLYDNPYNAMTLTRKYMYPPYATAHPGDIIVLPQPNKDIPEDVPDRREIIATMGSNDGRDFFCVVHPGDIIVMPQAYKDIPKNLLDRSEILEDWSTTTVRTFMHIPIARHPYGYSFVVLKVK